MPVANFGKRCCNEHNDGLVDVVYTSQMSQFLALENPHPTQIERQTHQAPLPGYFVDAT
jgi:hypothetical protein